MQVTPKECSQKLPSKTYIFVGSKIDVSYADTSDYCYMLIDSKYNANYKIEQEFGDHFPDSTIAFTAYDHNSMSQYLFKNYENILIFIGEYCGDLIHMKYQFFPVYKTQDGRWATPFDTYKESYKPEKHLYENIFFDKSVSFNLPDQLSDEEMAQFIKNKFPEKYYSIKNGKAYPIMGRYAEDIVKDWKKTYWSKLK